MKLVTVDMLRAHLLTAAFAAVSIQVAALTSLLLFDIDESAFESTAFRLASALAIATATLVARHAAQWAFSGAVESHHAVCRDQRTKRVSVAQDCPRRPLVILHLRFAGIPFELAERVELA